jgi:hypothetical protein
VILSQQISFGKRLLLVDLLVAATAIIHNANLFSNENEIKKFIAYRLDLFAFQSKNQCTLLNRAFIFRIVCKLSCFSFFCILCVLFSYSFKLNSILCLSSSPQHILISLFVLKKLLRSFLKDLNITVSKEILEKYQRQSNTIEKIV